MESTLKSVPGVFDVAAKLLEGKLGEAEVIYDSDEVTLAELEEVVPKASGERHDFKAIRVEQG